MRRIIAAAIAVLAPLLLVQLVFACGVCEVTIAKRALYSGYQLPSDHHCTGNGQTYTGGVVYHSAPTTDLQLFTFYDWWIQIEVCTPFTIANVRLYDRFGGEFGVELIDYSGGTGGSAPQLTTRGASNKVFLYWHIGTLEAGQCASVWLHVWTDHNPAGKQEFTSYGTYYLNSGAVVKWIDNYGAQHSLETPSLALSTVTP